ncbi:hypothetical protein BDZ90DRAFT_230152 [Jaminaea rosea]|uniref:L domain-like protein n=1 Tax=Jaminaea rosea TaxID=1569628 RepID=A0A316V3P9_9BASI|nr:hypothetical protein BDZ90DRAFT_230152 [Jaminaea rosea]PWN31161.1 hypothetical protein BDZ90DRAFT_230152 [Jaminaea rosea]
MSVDHPSRNVVAPSMVHPHHGHHAAASSSSSPPPSFAQPMARHSSSRSRAMPSEELLALVVEKRLAVNATSGGVLDTIDLSNRRLRDIPEEIVDIIKDEAVRLALAYNQIHTIPARFTQLHRLRYLNLRSNAISTFPEWLADMPRLEILDVSKNKLRRLPEEPRQLLQLRVFSVGQNRLRRLPTWLADMEHVRVLKIEENPLQWPPPHVSIAPSVAAEASAANAVSAATNANANLDDDKRRKREEEAQHRQWIAALKRWILDNAASERERALNEADDDNGSQQRHGRHHQQASIASSTSTAAAMVATPPMQGRALPPDRTDSSIPASATSTGVTSPNESSDSSFAINANTSATSAMSAASAASNATSARSSPERGFKIRPLMLARQPSVAGVAGGRGAASAGMTPNSSSQANASVGVGEASGVEEMASPTRVHTHAQLPASPARTITPTPPRERSETVATKLQPPLELQRVDARNDEAFDNPRPAPPPPPVPTSSSPVFTQRGASHGHGRTNSHSMAQSHSHSPSASTSAGSPFTPTGTAKRRLLKTKKSLPDMRSAGATLGSTTSSMREAFPFPSSSSSSATNAMTGSPTEPLSRGGGAAMDLARTRNRSYSIGGGGTMGHVNGIGSVLTRPLLNHATTADVVPAVPRLGTAPEIAIVEPSSPSPLQSKGVTPSASAPSVVVVRKPSARRAALLEAVGLDGDAEKVGVPGMRPSSGADDHQTQRDSYFKRLSVVQGRDATPSPIHHANIDTTTGVPAPLPASTLKRIDAARGILFALSQIFTALKQYALFASAAVVAEQLEPVLTVAGGTLETLIATLDRFDSRNAASSHDDVAVGAVLDASRESVETFRKVVSVLKLLLKPLQRDADVRYTRALVLMLYGATVEVGNAWREMGAEDRPHAQERVVTVTGLGRGGRPTPLNVAAASHLGVAGPGNLPSIAESLSPVSSHPKTPNTDMRGQRKRYDSDGPASAQEVREVNVPPMTAAWTSAASAPAGPATSEGQNNWMQSRRAARRFANASDTAAATPSSGGGGTGFAFGHRPLSRSLGDIAGALGSGLGSGVGIAPQQPHRHGAVGSASSVPAFTTGSAPPAPMAGMAQHQQRRAAGGLVPSSAPPARPAPATGKAVIDSHLLALIQSVTSTASGVWVSLLDHLPATSSWADGGADGGGIQGGSGGWRSSGILSPEEATPTALAPVQKRGIAGKETTTTTTLKPPSTEEDTQRLSAISPTPSSTAGGSGASRKLVELRAQCLSAAELTRRLQHTLERVQDEMESLPSSSPTGSQILVVGGDPTSFGSRHRLLEEGVAFVRSVTAFLVTMRAMSVTHAEALGRVPDCKRSLAALTRGTANVSVHLHFCAPGLGQGVGGRGAG